jgi:hypothetical protein
MPKIARQKKRKKDYSLHATNKNDEASFFAYVLKLEKKEFNY